MENVKRVEKKLYWENMEFKYQSSINFQASSSIDPITSMIYTIIISRSLDDQKQRSEVKRWHDSDQSSSPATGARGKRSNIQLWPYFKYEYECRRSILN